MHNQGASLCFGASGGITFAALMDALRSPGLGGWLTFTASLLSTCVGLWISERSRRTRIESDRARMASDALHDARLLAALAALQQQAHTPTMPASDLAHPHSEGS